MQVFAADCLAFSYIRLQLKWAAGFYYIFFWGRDHHNSLKKHCDHALTERGASVFLHRFSIISKDSISWDLHTDLLNYAALAN